MVSAIKSDSITGSFQRNLSLGILLCFFRSIISAIANIYGTTLFLSVYPTTWLAYFLTAAALIIVTVSLLLARVFAKKIHRNAILLSVAVAIIFLSLTLVQHFNFWHASFFISLICVSTGSISSIVLAILPAIFGIREYKRIANYLVLSTNIGFTLGSFLIPLILSIFKLDSLLYFLVIISGGSTFLVYFLNTEEAIFEDQEKKEQVSLFSYPLYRSLVFFTISSVAVWALLEYMFKFESALHYKDEALADFFGYFSGVVNFSSMIIGLTTTRFLLKQFRIDGLFLAAQLFVLLGSIALIIFPSLWTLGLLFSFRTIFYQNYIALGYDLILNILPSSVRVTGKFHLRSTIDPATSMIVYFLLFFFVAKIPFQEMVFLPILIFALVTFFVFSVLKRYRTSLREESEFKRFNFIDAFSSAQSSLLEPMAYRALKSKESGVILLGLSMFDKFEKKPFLPISVYEQLNNGERLVRKAAIRIIKNRQAQEAIPLLEKRITVEKDSEITFYLLDALATLHRSSALTFAEENLKKDSPDLRAAVLHILLNYSELNSFQKHEYEKELRTLIGHSDRKVSEVAIQVAATAHLIHLVPAILQKLSKDRKVLTTVRFALIQMGSLVIPFIVEEIANGGNFYLFTKLLAALPGEGAEKELLALYHASEPLRSTFLARLMNRRASKERIGTDLKEAALPAIEMERKRLLYLHFLLAKYSSYPFLAREIESRIHLAKERALYWLGIGTKPQAINKIMVSLLRPGTTVLEKQLQGKALELVEIEVKDQNIRNQILAIFEAKGKEEVEEKNLADQWLTKVIVAVTNPREGKEMDILLKVFELRQVELFKQLAGETLLAIAQETTAQSFEDGEIIFKEGDEPDGLYCISLGKVKIVRQGKLLNRLGEHYYFGELGLLDEAPRTASAIAEGDCTLLFLDKSTFDRLTDDIPEMLRTVTRVMTRYLRQNFNITAET